MKKSKIAALEKRHGGEIVELSNDDVVIVARNTHGNMLPPVVNKMTISEAVAFGAWDTSRGTMDVDVRLCISELTVYYDPEARAAYAVVPYRFDDYEPETRGAQND